MKRRSLLIPGGILLVIGLSCLFSGGSATRSASPLPSAAIRFTGYTNGSAAALVPGMISQYPTNAQRIQAWATNGAREATFTLQNTGAVPILLTGPCQIRSASESGGLEDAPISLDPRMMLHPGSSLTFHTAMFSKPGRWRLETQAYYWPKRKSLSQRLRSFLASATHRLVTGIPLEPVTLQSDWVME